MAVHGVAVLFDGIDGVGRDAQPLIGAAALEARQIDHAQRLAPSTNG